MARVEKWWDGPTKASREIQKVSIVIRPAFFVITIKGNLSRSTRRNNLFLFIYFRFCLFLQRRETFYGRWSLKTSCGSRVYDLFDGRRQ